MTDTDLAPLMQFYAAGRKSADFDEGIRRALTALLASPNFLYRVETSQKPAQVGQTAAPARADAGCGHRGRGRRPAERR